MEIVRYVSNLMFSNMYVLTENGHSLIIDPFECNDLPDSILPDLMLITHEHYDHISGVNYFKRKYRIPLLCSEMCASRIIDPKKNSARYFEAFCELQTYGEQDMSVSFDTEYTCCAEITFDDELFFRWQGNDISLFSLPGHSPGGIGIIINAAYFFSGDSLLPDHDVELRFPGGNKKDWREVSVGKIKSIHDDVRVYPGHRDSFLMKERRNNGHI